MVLCVWEEGQCLVIRGLLDPFVPEQVHIPPLESCFNLTLVSEKTSTFGVSKRYLRPIAKD
jgi:hypothetical protein